MTTVSCVSLVNAVEKESTHWSSERTVTVKARCSEKKWRPSSVIQSRRSTALTPFSSEVSSVNSWCTMAPSFFSST